MIDKREILDMATQMSLTPHVVEKDYVLGWMLAGINSHPIIRDAWVFKGGTCLKKCYFETYRFSEDLDFTLTDPAHIDEAFQRGLRANRKLDLRADRHRNTCRKAGVRHLQKSARHDLVPGKDQLSRAGLAPRHAAYQT